MDTHSFRGLIDCIVTCFFLVTAVVFDQAASHLAGTLFHLAALLAGVWTTLTVVMLFVSLRQGLLAWRTGEWSIKPQSFSENKTTLVGQEHDDELDDLFY